MYKTHMGPHGGIRIPESVQQQAGVHNKEEVYVHALAPGVIVVATQQAVTDRIRECSTSDEVADLLHKLW